MLPPVIMAACFPCKGVLWKSKRLLAVVPTMGCLTTTALADGSVTVNAWRWLGTTSDWFAPASWDYGPLFDSITPGSVPYSLPTFLGPGAVYVNGVRGPDAIPGDVMAVMNSNFTSSGRVTMLSSDIPVRLAIQNGAVCAVPEARIGVIPENDYTSSGPIVPAEFIMSGGASFTGNLTIGEDGMGKFSVLGKATVGSLSFAQADNSTGILDVSKKGRLIASAGVVFGAGTTNVTNRGEIKIQPSAGGPALDGLSSTGTWLNKCGSTLSVSGSASLSNPSSGSFTNERRATFLQQGSGYSWITWDFINDGHILVRDHSDLHLGGGYFRNGEFLAGNFSGTGSAEIEEGSSLNFIFTRIPEDSSLTVNGLIRFNNLYGPGKLTLFGDYSISNHSGYSSIQILGAEVTNRGHAVLIQSSGIYEESESGASWTNESGSSLTMMDNTSFLKSVGTTPAHFTNRSGSTLIKAGEGVSRIEWDFVNRGDIVLAEGSLEVGSTIVVDLAFDPGSRNTLQVGTGATAGSLLAAEIRGGAGIASVIFNHSETVAFPVPLRGNLHVRKSGEGTTILTGGHSYTGNTRVTEGELRIEEPHLADGSRVFLSSGATLHLAFEGIDTIHALIIDGVRREAGIWGGIGSGAPNTTASITGSGKLEVLSGVQADWTFGEWAADHELDGDEAEEDADPDGDGIVNLLEYAFNLIPVKPDSAVVAAGSDNSGLPHISRVEHEGAFRLKIEFVRRQASGAAGLLYIPQFSSNLSDEGDGRWMGGSFPEAVELIDDVWERVIVYDDPPDGDHRFRFGRVKVEPVNPPPGMFGKER